MMLLAATSGTLRLVTQMHHGSKEAAHAAKGNTIQCEVLYFTVRYNIYYSRNSCHVARHWRLAVRL